MNFPRSPQNLKEGLPFAAECIPMVVILDRLGLLMVRCCRLSTVFGGMEVVLRQIEGGLKWKVVIKCLIDFGKTMDGNALINTMKARSFRRNTKTLRAEALLLKGDETGGKPIIPIEAIRRRRREEERKNGKERVEGNSDCVGMKGTANATGLSLGMLHNRVMMQSSNRA